MLPKSYSSFAKFGVTRSVQLISSSGFAMSPKNCVTIFEGLLGHGFSVLIRNLFKYLYKCGIARIIHVPTLPDAGFV